MAGKRFYRILLSAAGLLLLDQLSQAMVAAEPPARGQAAAGFRGWLNLRLVWNDDAAFSLFRGRYGWAGSAC